MGTSVTLCNIFGTLITHINGFLFASDREVTSVYEVLIEAREVSLDSSSTATLTVHLEDINDSIPTCTTLVFNEERTETTAIGNVIQVSDCDVGCE